MKIETNPGQSAFRTYIPLFATIYKICNRHGLRIRYFHKTYPIPLKQAKIAASQSVTSL
ncbi:MAG: hypothetical protein ACQEXX_25530 [Bacillota bacterium]